MVQADSPDTTAAPADPAPSAGTPALSRRRLLGRLATSAAAGAVTTLPLPAVSASDIGADDQCLLKAYGEATAIAREIVKLWDIPESQWGSKEDELNELSHIVPQSEVRLPRTRNLPVFACMRFT
jgi:hypothetical protein